jgi:hypothetical protein
MSLTAALNPPYFPLEKTAFRHTLPFSPIHFAIPADAILSGLPLSESPSPTGKNQGWVYLLKKRGTQVGRAFRFANPCKQSPFRHLQGLSGINSLVRRKHSRLSNRNPNDLTACEPR